ncbi:hypothetical protein BP6252_02514 [Coleophoma cylindrospora]|uniref:2EXR domain-containing protein n=1 Tax=Coleophoma cylindrospora TaxID=1849047 RepID=A0A3D8SFM2_9HELO|nr:hypothetical protein BP6252_02514 [Coleophoma cylindrospora]
MASTPETETTTPRSARFHLFAQLPTELRLKIWKHCLPGPRILKISYNASLREYTSSTRAPVTLSINQEARAQTLLTYNSLALTTPRTAPPIPIDYTFDTVYISDLAPILQMHMHDLLYNLSTSRSRHQIQSLAIDRRVWNELCDNGLLGMLCRMRTLREVFMVVEFGREFVGDLAFLDTPDWRGDLKWVAASAMESLAEERTKFAGLRRKVGCRDLGDEEIVVKCVILMRGGEQA